MSGSARNGCKPENIGAAWLKSMPCFFMFAAFFRSSHSLRLSLGPFRVNHPLITPALLERAGLLDVFFGIELVRIICLWGRSIAGHEFRVFQLLLRVSI